MSNEQQPTDQEVWEHHVRTSLAILLLDLNIATVHEVQSAPGTDDPRLIWAAAITIEASHVDECIALEPQVEEVDLELAFHREELIGHWLVTGIEQNYGRAFSFGQNMADLALAFEMSANYLGGQQAT